MARAIAEASAAAARAAAAQDAGGAGSYIASQVGGGLYDVTKGFAHIPEWGANLFADIANSDPHAFFEDLGEPGRNLGHFFARPVDTICANGCLRGGVTFGTTVAIGGVAGRFGGVGGVSGVEVSVDNVIPLTEDVPAVQSSTVLRSIRSLEKQITEHQQKIADFKANPTIRPGMENLPKNVIEAQQQGRIRHLEKEINTFRGNIRKLNKEE
jgi:hypothetical protein